MAEEWWSWVCNPNEITIDTLLRAYHLNYSRSIAAEHAGSIANNPFWIKHMGEVRWLRLTEKQLMSEKDPDFVSVILQLREPGKFAGLVNFGTMCYANATLQTWFHNPITRRFILSMVIDHDDQTKAALRVLQNIFIRLRYSIFETVDAYQFYNILNLSNSEQHDAQEFSLKFMEGLCFMPELKLMIETNFEGVQNHFTKCTACGTVNVEQEKFRMILLGIEPSLEEAIGNQFQTEVLNDRVCSQCGERNDAERISQYTHLPHILQFQFNRFRYDVNEKRSVKITDKISYPNEIDMTPYIKNNSGNGDQDNIYAAFAALNHCGSGSNAGHYIVKIRDYKTGFWIEFNDAALDQQDSSENGRNSSREVYMVMYLKKCEVDALNLQTEVSGYENQLREQLAVEEGMQVDKKLRLHKQLLRRQSIIYDLQNDSKEGPIEEFDFIGIRPLREVFRTLDNPNEQIQIDNGYLRCIHGKVAPPRMGRFYYRAIPRRIADRLYAEFGGGPRFPVGDSMCIECIRKICSNSKIRNKALPQVLPSTRSSRAQNRDIRCSSQSKMYGMYGAKLPNADLPSIDKVEIMETDEISPIKDLTEEYPQFHLKVILPKTQEDAFENVLSIVTKSTTTIQQLKDALVQAENLETSSFEIFYDGQALTDNTMTLSDYGIYYEDQFMEVKQVQRNDNNHLNQ